MRILITAVIICLKTLAFALTSGPGLVLEGWGLGLEILALTTPLIVTRIRREYRRTSCIELCPASRSCRPEYVHCLLLQTAPDSSAAACLSMSAAVTQQHIVPVIIRCHLRVDTLTLYWALVHWPLMGRLLRSVQQGGTWAGCGHAQSPLRCTKYNSPRINGQCTTSY